MSDDKILAAIERTNGKIDTLNATVDALKQSVDVQWEKYDALNGKVDDHDRQIAVLETTMNIETKTEKRCGFMRKNRVPLAVGGGTAAVILSIAKIIIEAILQ